MSKSWTDYEDETLDRLTYEHVAGTMDQSTRWRRISDDINGIHDRKRSARSCEARWQRIMHYDAQNDVATQQCSDNTRRDAV